MRKETKGQLGELSALAIVLFMIVALFSFTIIDAGYRGVVISKSSGVQDYVLDEGFHLKTPIVDSVEELEVRTKKYTQTTESTTNDQQVVNTKIALNYNLDPAKVNKLYQEIGLNYEGRILQPVVNGAVKSVMAKYSAENIIRKRSKVSTEIQEEIYKRIDSKYITVTDFNLVDIKFSTDYTKAIEEKAVERQRLEREKIKLDRVEVEQQQKVKKAEAEAEAEIIQANATAEAIKIRQESLQGSPEYLQYFYIEKWDGEVPKVMGTDSDMLIGMNNLTGN